MGGGMADAATGTGAVVVTLKPVHALVAGVMNGVAGGIGASYLLLRGASSPHAYAMKPSDARALTHASVLFRVSPHLEVFLNHAVAALPGTTRVVSLIGIKGLTLHKIRQGGAFAAHDHEAHRREAHRRETFGAHGGTGAAAAAGRDIDPHIWLDPQNAKVIVADVARVLSGLQPAAAAKFNANAKALMARLDALDGQLARQLRPLAGKPYLVFHDAYQYLEKRYGLAPIGSVVLSPDQPAGPKRISALRSKVRRLGIRCIFSEPQFRPRLLGAIIEGTSARLGVLDPLGADLPPGPELYFTLMHNVAGALEHCLK